MIAPIFSKPIQIVLIAAAVGTTLQAQTVTVEPIFFGMHRTTGGLWRAGEEPISFAGWGARGVVHQGKWSLAADFINMRFFGLTTLPNPFSPEQGFSWRQSPPGEPDEFDTDYGELVMTYDGGSFQAVVGKFAEQWGPGLHSLTLSEKPPTYPQFGFDWQLNAKVRVIYRHGDLVSRVPDSSRTSIYSGPIGQGRIQVSRHVAAHRLEIAPVDRLTVGFTELVIYGSRGLELAYLLPFIPYWHVQHYLGDIDNVQMSADITVDLLPGLSLYGVFLMDEWRPQDTFKTGNRNWFAWQGGLDGRSIILEQDRLLVEATWTDHRVYRHRFPVNDAASHGYPLGNWIGPHAQSLQVSYQLPWQDSRWSVAYLYAQRGELTTGMLEEQYATVPYDRFSGETETVGSLELTMVRNVYRKLWLEAGISRIRWDNAGFNPAKPAPTEDVAKTSIQLGFYYNFDLPGYTITRMLDQ